jgi:hypothetical protein
MGSLTGSIVLYPFRSAAPSSVDGAAVVLVLLGWFRLRLALADDGGFAAERYAFLAREAAKGFAGVAGGFGDVGQFHSAFEGGDERFVFGFLAVLASFGGALQGVEQLVVIHTRRMPQPGAYTQGHRG